LPVEKQAPPQRFQGAGRRPGIAFLRVIGAFHDTFKVNAVRQRKHVGRFMHQHLHAASRRLEVNSVYFKINDPSGAVKTAARLPAGPNRFSGHAA
jgi:hypothetical protein